MQKKSRNFQKDSGGQSFRKGGKPGYSKDKPPYARRGEGPDSDRPKGVRENRLGDASGRGSREARSEDGGKKEGFHGKSRSFEGGAGGERDARPFRDRNKPFTGGAGRGGAAKKRSDDGGRDSRAGGKREDRPFRERDKPFERKQGERSAPNRRTGSDDRTEGKREDRPFRERSKPFERKDGERRAPDKRTGNDDRTEGKREDRPFRERSKPFEKKEGREGADGRTGERSNRTEGKREDRPFRERSKPFERNEGETNAPNKRTGEGREDANEGGERGTRPLRERGKSFARDGKKRGAPAADKRDEGSKKDTRPFRERNKGIKEEKPEKDAPSFSDVVKNAFNGPVKKKDENHPGKREQFEDKVYGELAEPEAEQAPKPYDVKKKNIKGKRPAIGDDEAEEQDGGLQGMPLNKYIAHSGECSRRDAAEFVKQGKVKVNGELVLDPGYRVQDDDKVTMSGKKLTLQKGMAYILLNKPRGFITTNEDPQGRKTVMQLVDNSGVDRLFPVGRLDRDTSGLLLITNDGDLTQKLCHPSYNVKKIYHVTLDKPLTKADFEKIAEGVELEDGKAVVDALAFLEKKNELGLEIHSGKNRIVRRIFESLGYVVDKLDRVMYAGLTKKNLPRSKWRYLSEREIVLLKHFKS